MIVLSEALQASSKGKAIAEPYRAILEMETKGRGYLVKVQQQIKGEWHSTGGSWYLKTLLAGFLDKPISDGISIDFGQQWQIDAGMRQALKQAVKNI